MAYHSKSEWNPFKEDGYEGVIFCTDNNCTWDGYIETEDIYLEKLIPYIICPKCKTKIYI